MGIFEKEQEELLNYDAHAFIYFAATLLIFILVPWSYYLIDRIRNPKPAIEMDFEARGMAKTGEKVRRIKTTAMETKRMAALDGARRTRWMGGVRMQTIVCVFLWCCLFVTMSQIRDAPANLKTFDPYQILGIESGADTHAIKKAYRQKSLQHHPDKDKDNPLAPVLFQQVSKAYAALTDEAARENYEKYGNPDGPVQMKVGIALHPALLVKEYQLFVLSIFFFTIFAVPFSIVWFCLRGSNVASTNGVCSETVKIFQACIDAEVKINDGPGLLTASAEMRKLPGGDIWPLIQAMTLSHPEPIESGSLIMFIADPLSGRRGRVKTCPPPGSHNDQYEVEVWPQDKPPQGPEDVEIKKVHSRSFHAAEPRFDCPFSDAIIRRGTAILWGHMWRLHKDMEMDVKVELTARLLETPKLCRAMIAIAVGGEGDRSGFLNVASGLIKLQRCLVQALDFDANPLLQLPYVTKVPPKELPSLREVVESGGSEAVLKKIGNYTPNQIVDIQEFCRNAPLAELTCTVEVADEEEISESDIATLKVTLTRKNLGKDEAAGPVHAPLYPGPKFEEWWIIIYDSVGRRMVSAEPILGTSRVETVNVNFMVPRHGDFRWKVYAMCDAYMGLDVACDANFKAVRKNEVNREIFIHPEDAEIKTFFEELVNGLQEEEQDSDSEDEDEVSKKKPKVVEAKDDEEEEAVKPVEDKKEGPADSDEEDEEAAQIPDGVFYQVTDPTGQYLHREPSEEKELRRGCLPFGTVIRGFEGDDRPEGWMEVSLGTDVWVKLDGGVDEDAEAGKPQWPLKSLGGLYEQPLSHLVKSYAPIVIVRRWMKKTEMEITPEDLLQVRNMDNSRARIYIEDLICRHLGEEKFEKLLDGAEALIAKFATRIEKARGYFSTANGIIWHVSPDGTVRGLNEEGGRISDKVQVTDDNKNMFLGPFVLDETKTCPCIHWLRKDDPDKSWTWARDNSLQTRVRLVTGEKKS
eukprot:TRINITY_DN20033_c0_g1_i1.p1 TRINITY_DN20033_c0_g1~~TRINITY_DN20033_c0_g1_i1.p1  ORF type:complete len:975 (+),score=241.32 TRINITY_DN20033_c0_g1_i1:85-3009(+)